MYSKKYLLDNFDFLSQRFKLRGVSEELMINLRTLIFESLDLQKQLNVLERKRNELLKLNDVSDREIIREIKHEISDLSQKEKFTLSKLDSILHFIPNIPDLSLTNKSELIKEWGDKKMYLYKPLSHKELSENHDLFSLGLGSTIAGSGYVVYKDKGADIYRSLIRFTLDKNKDKGYLEYWLPVLVDKSTLFGTAQLPKFEDDLFKSSDSKYLSPTSETQLVNLYRNRIIESKDLPIKMTANTNCFRREAGASGTDTSGIIRLHQFNKTELVVICKESESFHYLEIMLKDACDILESLNLPYRILQLAYDDIGFAASKTYDIEVWFPSENRYREISSVSNTLDFQSRRAMIRYKDRLLDKNEKSKYPHVLNGSSLAIDRLFAAILENYQNEDGSIDIPDALKTYLGFEKLIKKD